MLYSQYSAVVLQENSFQFEPEVYFVVVIKCLLMVTWVPNCLCQLQSKSYHDNFRPKPSWQKCSYQLQSKAIFMVPKCIFRLSICGHSQQQAQLQKTPTRISKKTPDKLQQKLGIRMRLIQEIKLRLVLL